MKVLIYGFGWSGQSALSLCEKIGFECKVVDDGIDLDFTKDERFISFEAVNDFSFDLFLVCLVDTKQADICIKKLRDIDIDEGKIKCFSFYEYREKMGYLVKSFFASPKEVLQGWLRDDKNLSLLQEQIKKMKQEYHRDKRESTKNNLDRIVRIDQKMPDLTIFSKLYHSSLTRKGRASCVCYPSFNIGISSYKEEDKNFYFIEKIDFEKLMHRPKNIKLIACFGNSALRVEYLPKEEAITGFLKQKLDAKEYIVLNFGVTGYTVYEQMMLYGALVYPLKPEIVISYFGGTDWRSGFVSCERLIKLHKMTYTPGFYEYAYKVYCGSEIPLYLEQSTEPEAYNQNITIKDINEAICVRLEQFRDIVLAGGGGICTIYPAFIAA